MAKRTLPVPSLSLKSLAQFLAPYPHNDKLWEQGELELYELLEAWDARVRAQKETPKTREFRQRYEDFCRQHNRRNRWSVSAMTWPNWVVTPSDAFIWKEFQAFINQADARGKGRREIVDSLGATPEDIERIQELCFIPTVIFPCVLEIAKQLDHLYKAALKEKRRFKSRIIDPLKRGDILMSEPLKTRVQEEFELIEHVFKVKYPRPRVIKKWREQLGLDKGVGIARQKHRIWRYICRELVVILRPYCQGPKKNTKQPVEVPTDARDIASQLLHLSAPELWPDGLEGSQAVENRYQSTKREAIEQDASPAVQRIKSRSDEELGIGTIYEEAPDVLEELIRAGIETPKP